MLYGPFHGLILFFAEELEHLSTSDDQNLLAAVYVSLFVAG